MFVLKWSFVLYFNNFLITFQISLSIVQVFIHIVIFPLRTYFSSIFQLT